MKKPEMRILDKLWRTVGKGGAVCSVCASLSSLNRPKCTQMHPHHIEGRKNRRLRWDLMNRIWLCPTHHTMGTQSAHQSPVWFIEWMKIHNGRQYDYVYNTRIESGKYLDFDEVKTYLEKGKIRGLRRNNPVA